MISDPSYPKFGFFVFTFACYCLITCLIETLANKVFHGLNFKKSSEQTDSSEKPPEAKRLTPCHENEQCRMPMQDEQCICQEMVQLRTECKL